MRMRDTKLVAEGDKAKKTGGFFEGKKIDEEGGEKEKEIQRTG